MENLINIVIHDNIVKLRLVLENAVFCKCAFIAVPFETGILLHPFIKDGYFFLNNHKAVSLDRSVSVYLPSSTLLQNLQNLFDTSTVSN